jgi:hypothetical protein
VEERKVVVEERAFDLVYVIATRNATFVAPCDGGRNMVNAAESAQS